MVKNNLVPYGKTVIERILREEGVERDLVKKPTYCSIEEDIVPLWKDGISLREIAKKFNTTHTTLSNKLKELGYTVENLHTKCKFNENVFNEIDTEEKAYWLGFIYADGNVATLNSKGLGYKFTVTLKLGDIEHLRKLSRFMEHETENIRIPKNAKTPQCVFEIGNKHLWYRLNELGVIPNKSLKITFPEQSIFKSQDLIRHFIRGYFDGDGCISYDKLKYTIIPRLSMLGTKDFLSRVADIINYNKDKIRTRKSKHEYFEIKLNSKDSEKFMHYLYDDCTIYLDRKYNRYKAFSETGHIPIEKLEEFKNL